MYLQFNMMNNLILCRVMKKNICLCKNKDADQTGQ